jgi:hypothetical protein
MLEKIKANVATIIAIITSCASGVAAVSIYIGKIATDEELATFIAEHDKSARAHSTTLLLRIESLEEANKRIFAELAFCSEGAKHLGARFTRITTADTETNRFRKEQTASYHETLYWQCIERKNNTPDDKAKREAVDACIRDSVNTPIPR